MNIHSGHEYLLTEFCYLRRRGREYYGGKSRYEYDIGMNIGYGKEGKRASVKKKERNFLSTK